MKSRIALVVFVVIVAIVLLAACVRNAGKTPAVKNTAVPAAKTNVSAPTPIPQSTVAPTATLPPPKNADELYANGGFPGILYSAARAKIARTSAIAGESYTTANETKIGDGDGGIGWNQPFAQNKADWSKYLAYQTAWEVPAGQTAHFVIRYETVILDPPGSNWQAPYSSYWNAVLLQNMQRPEFTGKFFAEGLSLTGPQGSEIAIVYEGGSTCTAPSVQMTPDKWLTVDAACPAGAVSCIFAIGQYGAMYDLTGQLAPDEVQTLGGNIAQPGCADASFPGTFQWLQSFK